MECENWSLGPTEATLLPLQFQSIHKMVFLLKDPGSDWVKYTAVSHSTAVPTCSYVTSLYVTRYKTPLLLFQL